MSTLGIKAYPDGLEIGGRDGKDKIGFFGASRVAQQTFVEALTTTGAVVDDDDAATNGTAVNVVPVNGGPTAYLESTTANNADAVAAIASGGPSTLIKDNDSPGGVALYFDEDAAATDSRFLANSPTGSDLFVTLSDGSVIRVKHDATPTGEGVAVYFDDNGANNYERLLFVSPTDTAGSFTTDDVVGMQSPERLRTTLINLGLMASS